jgi:hypothetical protein
METNKTNPIFFALIWTIINHTLSSNDILLARQLYQSPDWFILSEAERQWVEMLIGSNLEYADQATQVLRDELSELGDLGVLEEFK